MAAPANDRRLIGQGREAEVFLLSSGRVLKLLRAHGATVRLACEVAALAAARSAGVRVPEVYEQVVIDGRPGIVMERVNGPDLLSFLGRQPWFVWRGGHLTGKVHAQINGIQAPASLPRVRDVVRDALVRIAQREPSVRLEWFERALSRLPDGDALCHGDFHPGQLVYADAEPAVLDWAGAKRGDALCDYARTRVLLRTGELPPGTPRDVKVLAAVGRRVLLSSYTRSYERHTKQPVDHARVRDWEIVNLAVRLFDKIPGERDYLLRRLRTLEPAAVAAER